MSQPRRLPRRMSLAGRTALITGAGGGIGRATSLSLAKRGAHLALADVNDAGMAHTAAAAEALGAKVSQHHLDVADEAAVAALPAAVLAGHPSLDILINNAGVALGGTFEQVSARDFAWLFEINFWGVVRMTRAFLPLLRASDDARLVNLSSIFGIIAPPGQTAYSASKFAVRGFSESLRRELAGSRIGVTVVHPGGVATSIAQNARIPAGTDPAKAERQRQLTQTHLTLPPEAAGEIIVRGIEARRPRVLVGRDAKIAALIERLAPVTYFGLLGASMSSKFKKKP